MSQELPVIQRESEKPTPPQVILSFSDKGIGTLVGALAKARLEFGPVIKSKTNPFYKSKYADLTELINAVDEPLSKNGLVIIQAASSDLGEQDVTVATLLAHESGEWIKALTRGPGDQKSKDKETQKVSSKFDIQTEGASVTYLRRISTKAILFLPEEDDDGNSLVEKPKAFVPPKFQTPLENLPKPVVAKPSPESELRSDSDGAPLSDKDLPENLKPQPKPTGAELKGYSDRLKNLKMDNRLLKSWFEKQTKTEWRSTSREDFDRTVSLAEQLHKDGKLMGVIAAQE